MNYVKAGTGCRRRGRAWGGRRRWCRRRCWHIPGCLDQNRHRCAGLEESDGAIREIWRLVRIKTEIVESAKANCVRVLILRKSFCVPGNGACVLSNSPRHAAVSNISLCAIIRPAGVLNWRMEPNVRDIDSRSKRYGERLDRAIQVLIIERVFIMPDTGTGARYSEAHEPDTIISRVGFLPVYSRAGPGHDCRLLAHRGANGAKGEVCRAATHGLLPVGRIVVHVALAWMTLAPGVFVRDDVFRFGKIGGVLVLGWNKVIRVHQNSMRRCVMGVTAVIVGR